MLDFGLSEDQERFRQKVREFARDEVLPLAWEYDERDEMPLNVLRKAHDLGIMNLDIPGRHGGAGQGLVEGVLAVEEIAACCPGVATSVFDNSLGLTPLLLGGNETAREKYLPQLVREFRLICFAVSEPGMGSDVAGMRCLARPDGEDYVLEGTKYWVTNAGHADFITAFATVDPALRHEGICAFVVERTWPGVQVGRPIPKLGQRCSNTAGVRFDGVQVPRENVLAGPGEGFKLAMRTFDRTRPVIGAFGVGAARAALEYARDHARRRRAFGQEVSGFEGIRFMLARMYARVETARLLVWKAAWEVDRGVRATASASIAKLYASETALEVVNDALQIMGGYGYTRLFPVEKLLRDVRLLSIYEGTSEVQQLILAGHVLAEMERTLPPLDEVTVRRGPRGGQALWRCPVCGYVHEAPEPPERCPYCFVSGKGFAQVS